MDPYLGVVVVQFGGDKAGARREGRSFKSAMSSCYNLDFGALFWQAARHCGSGYHWSWSWCQGAQINGEALDSRNGDRIQAVDLDRDCTLGQGVAWNQIIVNNFRFQDCWQSSYLPAKMMFREALLPPGSITVEAGAATLLIVVFFGSEAREVTATGIAVAYSIVPLPPADNPDPSAPSVDFISSRMEEMLSAPIGLVSWMTTLPTSGSSCRTVSFDGSTVSPCNCKVWVPPPLTWTWTVEPLAASGGKPWIWIFSPVNKPHVIYFSGKTTMPITGRSVRVLCGRKLNRLQICGRWRRSQLGTCFAHRIDVADFANTL